MSRDVSFRPRGCKVATCLQVADLSRNINIAPPVAVPDKICRLTLFFDFIDRCHSLRSLYLPPAALPSLPHGRYDRFRGCCC